MATAKKRKPRKPKRAILLCRISDGRDPDSVSIPNQKRDGRRFGDYLGWGFGPAETHLVIEDGVSAYKRKQVEQADGSIIWRTVRPEFKRALEMLHEGEADGLIAYNLDRTIRDPYDLEDLIGVVYMRSPKIPVRVVTGSLRLENDDDIAMARTLTAFANKSSSDTGRRVARTARSRAEAGRFGGGVRRFGRGVPTGQKRLKRVRDRETGEVTEVEVDVLDMNQVREDEAEQVEKAADDLLDGVSFRQVFRNLVESGVKPVKAEHWSERSLRQILLSPHIAGLASYSGTSVDEWDDHDDEDEEEDEQEEPTEREPLLYPAQWPEIISEEKWRAVSALLKDPSRRTTTGPAPKWLGSLIYICGKCRDEFNEEATLTMGKGGPGKKKDDEAREAGEEDDTPKKKRRAPTYVCPRHFHLAHKAKELDEFVEKAIIARLSQPDTVDLLHQNEKLPDDEVVRLRAELVTLSGRKKTAARQFADGVIDGQQLAVISTTVRDRTAEINNELRQSETHSSLTDIAGRSDAAEVWETRSMDQRRDILRELFTVTILPAVHPGARGFDPERVVIEPKREPTEKSGS